jgi:hypothetical protein
MGGTKFEVGKQHLLKHEHSYFQSIASGRWKPESDGMQNGRLFDIVSGAHFVDRDPKHFDRVVDYFRTGKLDLSELSASERKKVGTDLDFFQIKVQLSSTWDLTHCGAHITLSENDTVATKSGPAGWNAAVLGNASVEKFSFTVTNRASGNIMIGFGTRSINKNGSNHNSPNAWYLIISNGTVCSSAGQASFTGALPNGTRVVAIHNKTAREISFSINDAQPIVAFRNVNPTGDLYPSVDMHDQGASITLLN